MESVGPWTGRSVVSGGVIMTEQLSTPVDWTDSVIGLGGDVIRLGGDVSRLGGDVWYSFLGCVSFLGVETGLIEGVVVRIGAKEEEAMLFCIILESIGIRILRPSWDLMGGVLRMLLRLMTGGAETGVEVESQGVVLVRGELGRGDEVVVRMGPCRADL